MSWLSQVLNVTQAEESWQEEAKEAMLADTLHAKAFGITGENVDEVIQTRSHLLRSVLPSLSEFCQTTLRMQTYETLEVLWNVWLPLATKLASQRQKAGHPIIQGILGGQGTGKTTMCKVLTLLLQELGYCTLNLSLDDLYKTYSERLKLQQQDPRLIWRGPPGTHDIELGLSVLDDIQKGKSPVVVPRFDKSAYSGAGDRTTPEIVENVDIVLFEGWFVGARPIEPAKFETPPPPIITDEDRTFARDINSKLRDYLPLWDRLHSLIVLYPTDYRLSLEWRKQAEQQMIAAGKSGMSDKQIEEFVNYFWRSLHPELFIKPLVESSTFADLVIEIQPDHTVGRVYRPSDVKLLRI
ncbi:glycerate kinase [Aetokthonos hydrillicola Thurmond2011]|uniref:Glycerate kinase n=1 Tax=Aetokthonos hydrillicola Thurmond2011 TaxID=2712845 RepID=A0AAP5MBI1_9CYAN|nr:glycerate kinase [Aetokthonos hydrillicola]MBO3460688.1 glycerate kinase [Aetokthonos hydrillicola CCALA 1050]MBW4587686.1 glycerate kinase [Aetokthonos hydrillicola CCALA 1050]MDR9897932.1 glycerate kinase [Aetokthonos hydrillicola Thurmond2011]